MNRFTFYKFARDERAGIAIMFALLLPVIFGLIGLAIEAGVWFKDRGELQAMADAAAVSAAVENSYGATSAELTSIATMEATRNGFDATTDSVTYVGTPTSGTYSGDSAYTEVILTRQLETVLSQVFINFNPSTFARAVAGTTGDQDACVLALDTSAQNSIYVNGSGTTVNMDGCAVVANSSHASKAVNVQNGTLNAECISTPGGINGSANINTNCASNITGGNTVTDPFASLDVPTIGACDEDPAGNQAFSASGAISEGVYCGGISVSSGATVTMSDGIYIMDEGDFTVNGGGTITSSGPKGVTIILTSSSGSGYGTVSINGGGTVELQAPIEEDLSGVYQGDYTGILFYQDRNGGSSPSLDISITGGSDVELMGAMYSPMNDISFSGGSTLDNNGCLMLIAQTVSFNGSADLNNECDIFGGNQIKYGASPGLVE